MKKVLHMHSNIFDSTHQREIKSTDNVFGKFLTNEGCHPLDGIYKTKMECLISKHSTKSYHRRILLTDFSSYPLASLSTGPLWDMLENVYNFIL